MSEPSTKLGKRLLALMSYDANLTDWDHAAACLAKEIRGEDIPRVHKILDDVGAPIGMDIEGRIRAFASLRAAAAQDEAPHAHGDMTWSGASGDGDAPARLTEKALNACKAFNAPTDPSDAVVYLATLLDEGDAVRGELRAIIVEAIKGGA